MTKIVITNLKNGLKKIIDATNYTVSDFVLTFKTYTKAGYSVEVKTFKTEK